MALTIIFWVLMAAYVIPAFIFGFKKLIGHKDSVAQSKNGVTRFGLCICWGLVEITGSCLMLFNPTRIYSIAIFPIILTGALYTHVKFKERADVMKPIFVGSAFSGDIFIYLLDISMQYWIIVVSKDHIVRGIAGGFIQANHGKAAPLKKMGVGDGIICYSPKVSYSGNEPLQAFTAIGEIADDNVYQHQVSEDFIPYRRNVNYYSCNDTPITPLISELSFITDKHSWGFKFRLGFFEIPEKDFKLISAAMVI
jgi:hypothetical protein